MQSVITTIQSCTTYKAICQHCNFY
jgi:hypothetical protein